MNEQAEKYLKLARNAREGNDAEDAKKYYDMVRTEDPDNPEAAFYYLYYRLWDSVKGEWKTNFINLCERTPSAIKKVPQSDMTDGEKLNLLRDMFRDSKDLWQNCRKVLMDINVNSNGIVRAGFTYDIQFGDAVEQSFGGKADFMALAAEAWKAALDVYSNHRNIESPGTFKEETINAYIAKVQKVEPTYVFKKAAGAKGCITVQK